MKKTILIILAISTLLTVGCQSVVEESDDIAANKEQVIEQKDQLKNTDRKPDSNNGRFDLKIEDLDTTNFSKEQMGMLEKLENEEITMQDLLNSGLFTREELGMGTKQGMLPPKENLNLEGLSEEELDLIEKLYNDEISFEEVLNSFTPEQIQCIGLRGAKTRTNQN